MAPAVSLMSNCLNIGIAARDVAPRQLASVGTSRQARTVSPSSPMMFSIAACALSALTLSMGRNAMPTA